MSQRNNEKFIVFVASLGSVGLMLENFFMGWEFWVPPVILVGLISIWAIHLSDRIDEEARKAANFIFAALLIFYRGIHKTSLFDTALVFVLVMVVYSLFGRAYMMHATPLEFFVVLFIHFSNLPGGEPIPTDRFSVSRILLHICIVLLVYYFCTRNIEDRLYEEEERKEREERIASNDSNMEDFLSNISHELRTPVNVVNGMSDLLIKRGAGYEAESIKKAGVRLAWQIEDIQDYTECRRNKVFLEEDNYMSTSLINDVVTSFRSNDNTGDLDLIVDLSPSVPTMLRGDIKKLHKIFRHLLENAVKFTKSGGIYVRLYTEKMDYGVNLTIEMTDTGIGIDRKGVQGITEGMYQANKKRNRSSGGIGLGLYIVYGFAHRMGGFVKIETEIGSGTTIRVTVPQKIVDEKPCLALSESFDSVVLFHVKPDKYKVPRLRDFYRSMASNLALGVHVSLFAAETVYEVERFKEKMKVSHIFMGQEEYDENKGYFEALAREDIVVVVSADQDYRLPENSSVMLMPKPLYAYPVIKILNEGRAARDMGEEENTSRPEFHNVRTLVVDDEPMNLVVATSLFRDYNMVVDTAGSGKESIKKCREYDYDLVFMDHMMPEMDGVQAMKQIKAQAADIGKEIPVIALTANAVSGAREMFIKEGFDGFIAKPINRADFERVVQRVLQGSAAGREEM